MNRDKLFLSIVLILTAIIVLYSVAIVVVILVAAPSESVIVRFIGSVGTLFAGLLGVCSGYLMAQRSE